MKNAKKILGLLILLSIFSGCKKWIEFNPHDQYAVTEQDYLKSESDYQKMVVSCYTPMQWLNQFVVIGDMASDNSVTGGESASDVPALQQINNYTVTPENSTLTNLWQSAYEGINRADFLIDFKDKNPAGQAVNFTGKEALYGQVYFLRAYYYFTLVRLFGGVVLLPDRKVDVADFGTFKRSTKEETYAKIESDLKQAMAVLPPTSTEPGRITRYAAEALLGKVYLYENKFDEAAQTLQDVVDGPFSLVSDFNSIFQLSGENGPGTVFSIQYSNLSPYYNWSYPMRGQGNFAVQQCGVRGINGTDAMPYAPGWSTNLPTKELASAYAAGDQRKDATVFDVAAYKDANPDLNVTYQEAPYENTGLYDKKYLPMKGQTSGQPELNYTNNQRIIRYADVLLMAAEAYNRSTTPDDAKAQEYLNRVRRRAFGDNAHDVTATGHDLLLAIWHERRLELAMEGDRFFDLVRQGRAAEKIDGFVQGKNEVFPIPQREIDISGLKQNPNW